MKLYEEGVNVLHYADLIFGWLASGGIVLFVALLFAWGAYEVGSNAEEYVPYSIVTYSDTGKVLSTYPLAYEVHINRGRYGDGMVDFVTGGRHVVYHGNFEVKTKK